MKKSIRIKNEFLGTKTEDNWSFNAFKTTLKYGSKQMTVPFKMGLGLSGEPDVGTVLPSLFVDHSAYANARDFEDFCTAFGYDTESRKAKKLYIQCGEIGKKLENFLGDDFSTWEKKYEDY